MSTIKSLIRLKIKKNVSASHHIFLVYRSHARNALGSHAARARKRVDDEQNYKKKHRNIDQLEDVAADSSFADDILHNYQILDNVNVHLWRFKKTFAEE